MRSCDCLTKRSSSAFWRGFQSTSLVPWAVGSEIVNLSRADTISSGSKEFLFVGCVACMYPTLVELTVTDFGFFFRVGFGDLGKMKSPATYWRPLAFVSTCPNGRDNRLLSLPFAPGRAIGGARSRWSMMLDGFMTKVLGWQCSTDRFQNCGTCRLFRRKDCWYCSLLSIDCTTKVTMPASTRAVTLILNFVARTVRIRFSVRMEIKSIHQSLSLSQRKHVLLDLIVNVLESHFTGLGRKLATESK